MMRLHCPHCRAVLSGYLDVGDTVACPACGCECSVPNVDDAVGLWLPPGWKYAVGLLAVLAAGAGVIAAWALADDPVLAMLATVAGLLVVIVALAVCLLAPSYRTPPLRALRHEPPEGR
jgi:hypothetical protein